MIDFALVGVADERHRLFVHPVERRRAGVHVVGYSEPDETARAEFAVLHETPAFAGHRELLDGAKPTMIAVASPVEVTAEVVRDALAAGVDVIVAPPLTGSLAEVDRLAEAATAGGRRLAVVHTYRNHPAFRLARELFDQGRLGRIREVVLEAAAEVADDALAAATREVLELFRWFTGVTEGTVTGGVGAGTTVRQTGETEELVIMSVRGSGPDGDALAEVIRHPSAAGDTVVVQLIGDEGAVAWEVGNGRFRSMIGDRPSAVIACGLPADEAQWVLTDLIRRPAPSTVAEQLLSTRISLLADESARQGGAELRWRV
ncbi:Gfo/Idh/MocA family protein [Microlunatus parietis]|uniref:Putative dehydrogenase n=1 Tax=Microlunatus parietis TaxID=682979 RepID=A0A7Y9IB78_9ACTN|nr:Gfo/Idh/MocA family oxidoreductase [Microlunatus parietis]NYE73433.1 putative dehydrogenase [Microlunatus parietis]